MIVVSKSLENVLWEYGDKEYVDRFENKYGKIRDVVLKSSYPLGLLMYVSSKNGFNLSFKDLDFDAFISVKTLECNLHKMVEEVVKNTQHLNHGMKNIFKKFSEEMEKPHNILDVCRGHDIVDILTIGFKHIFGGTNAKGLTSGELSGALRLAYSKEMFFATNLYKESKQWSDSNNCPLWITEE